MTATVDETLRVVWCPQCRRYLGEVNTRRSALVAIADAHRVARGHGVWLEACGPVTHDRTPARRSFDSVRLDEDGFDLRRKS